MPIDESIANKSSEEMTKEDVGGLMKSPPKGERPLVELGVFEQQQPKPPIYKNIPLKFLVASVFVLIVMIPVMRLFAGNLLSGNSAKEAESVESVATVETEEETAQRLLAEENTDLKRKLALQNQSFTAQQIEEAEGTETVASEQNAQTQTASIPNSPPARPAAACDQTCGSGCTSSACAR